MSTNPNNFSKHSFFMNLALKQAKKNLGNTKENPSVGCVIVKNNCVVSADSTSFNGRPHAEQNAIKTSRNNVNNSTLYVTLEPCSNFGKTPPCVNTIIKNNIKKVFFSLKDPDPKSFNKSSKKFKKSNVYVNTGIYLSKVSSFYRSYIKFKKSNLPFVTAKIAISKDFFTKNRKNKWITNKYSRGRVHLMRSNHDCIITSATTISKDNPKLTCRINGLYKTSPTRIILDKRLKISPSCKVVKNAFKYATIIFYNNENNKKIKILKKLKVKLIKFPLSNNEEFNLNNILSKLKDLGFSRIFLEAGPKLTKSFLNDGLINDFYLFISNKKINRDGANSFKETINFFFKKKRSTHERVNLFGDKLIYYRFK